MLIWNVIWLEPFLSRFCLYSNKTEILRDYVFARILLGCFEDYWDLVEPGCAPGPVDSE